MSNSSKSRLDEYDPVIDYHHLKFENRCLRASGDDFQSLFEAIMVRARPGEFERVRPYGKYGDRKCDGLIESEGIIFQVYSPDELKQAKVQKKIDEDLEGAVHDWRDILKKWVFVYNVKRGIAADIKLTLQQKRQQYPDIEIDCWSNDYLWEIARNQLSLQQRCEILGAPPQSTANTKKIAAHSVHHQEHKTKWREICRELLNHWKGLTTNALMKPHGVRFQLDEIFVPLGVVERREKSKHRSNDGVSAEQGSELYEEKITPISQNDFFEQVLRQRQSKHSQGKRIAIIGEPGAGKTTQLQKIGDWILDETDGIPIWIPLTEVGTRKLREYLLGDWLQTATQELEILPEHRDELGQLLKPGKVWLLLDGVDEIATSDALYQIATQMREGWLQNVRVVLTCRLNVWDAGKNALDGFDVYRNLDFEYPTEVHQFVDKWFVTEPALQQKLKVALEQPGKERIRDMVKNPLRLTLLCYSWQLRQGELPKTKAGLYEWFVDTFYEWNKGKVPIQLSAAKREELNRALGELAKGAIDQETSRFRLQEKFISRFLGAADDKDSLFYLALQLGWLNRIGVAEENSLENVYAFFHPTFQEYFAAFVIDDWREFWNKTVIYKIFESQWHETILLWIGRDAVKYNHKEEFIFDLKNFVSDCGIFYDLRAYFLVAECVSEYENSQYADGVFREIIKWSLHFVYPKDHIKLEKIETIFGKEKEQQIAKVCQIKALTRLITQDNESLIELRRVSCISSASVELARKIDVRRITRIIVELLEDPENSVVFSSLLYTLAKLGENNYEAISKIANVLRGLSDDDDKYSIYDIFEDIENFGKGNELIIKILIEQIEKTLLKDLSMQISLLGEIAQDHSVAIKTLFNFIKNYEINSNVYFAIKSLTKMDKANPDLVLYIILILRDSHKWHDTYMFYGEIYEDLENCGWVKICQDNLSYFISNLDQLAKGFVDDSNCCFTADFLMSVDKENKSIQNILAVIKDKLIESVDERVKSIGQHENDIVLTHIAEVLERIEPGCCLGIELLLKLKEIKGLDSNIVYSLSEVAKINSLATQLLKNFYTEQCDKETKQQIEDALIEIDDHIYNLRINKVLRKFSKCERNIYMHLADALNRSQTKLSSFELREIETIAKRFIALSQKINRRNNIVFSDFSRLFKDYHDHFSFIHKDMEIFRITITIVINHLLNNHWKVILNSVNLHLEKTVNSREEFEDFEQCFEVAWLISQRVDYLEFYEVWNRSSISYQL